jgi:hypothetical protein
VRTSKQILAAISTGPGPGRSLAERLCVDCTSELRLSGAGLALMNDDGHQAVAGASGRIAAYLEDLQFELGEGPGVDASRFASPGLHPDLTAGATTPWVEFGPAAMDAGVRAVFAFPLQVGAVRLGCLSMYRPTPGALNREEMSTALAYADAAVVVLLHLQAQATAGWALAPELGEPLEQRAEVHQATGFVSIQASIGLTEALLLMRAHAFASGRPLLHVAREVLAGRLRIGADEE